MTRSTRRHPSDPWPRYRITAAPDQHRPLSRRDLRELAWAVPVAVLLILALGAFWWLAAAFALAPTP